MRKEEFKNATLYCGDCMEILPQINIGGGADAIVTDPPYEIGYETNYRKIMQKPEKITGDDRPPLWCVKPLYETLKEGGALYLCTSFIVFSEWEEEIKRCGFHIKTPIVWDKGNWTAGDLHGDYGNQCELIIFAHKGKHKLKDGRPSNIWKFPRDKAGEHPTPKPVPLMQKCIHNSVERGGLVIDPFMGSGSTGVAAMKEGARFIGIEISEKYFDIACRRIEQEQNQISIFDFMEA